MFATVGCGRSMYFQYFFSNAAIRPTFARGERYTLRTLVLYNAYAPAPIKTASAEPATQPAAPVRRRRAWAILGLNRTSVPRRQRRCAVRSSRIANAPQ